MKNELLRGYNDIIILSILYSIDSYGYEISKKIYEMSNFSYMIKEATLYSALNRLENLGLITSYAGDETNGSPRTYYKITNDGVEYYLNKRKEWIMMVDIMYRFLGGTANG
jgi:PadR family transcriptional regulator PadR